MDITTEQLDEIRQHKCALCELGVDKFNAEGDDYHRAKVTVFGAPSWLRCPTVSVRTAQLIDGERILREDIDAQAKTIQELRASLASARREALEEAAKVADGEYDEQARLAEYHNRERNHEAVSRCHARARTASDIAALIRALIPQGGPSPIPGGE